MKLNTLKEIQEMLGLSKMTVRKALKTGMPHYQKGRCTTLLFNKEEVIAWIKEYWGKNQGEES